MNTLLLATLLACPGAATDTWPAFQGVGATKVDPATLPLKWSATENVSWKTALPGQGQSSPIIWGDKVFVTCIEGEMKDTCHVIALSLADGSIAWDYRIAATQKVRSNYFQSRSASTPVVDSERVYAFFETGELVALTHEGKPAWSRCLVKDFGPFESRIGLAGSLAQTRDAVVLLCDHEGPSYLLAVDKKTGKTLWKTERDSRNSYASPTVMPIGKTDQIVCSSEGTVDGYDPATGKLLWSFDEVGGNNVAIPFMVEPGKFLVSGRPGMHNEREKEAKRSNMLMSVAPNDDGSFSPTVMWRVSTMPSFASPMSHAGIAYWVNNAGVVTAFDVKNGKQLFDERIKQPCWVAPLGFGDRIYFFGKDGLTTVLKAGPEFEVIAENALWKADPMERKSRGEGNHETPKAGPNAPKDGERPTAKDGDKQPAREGKERTGRAPGGKIFADPVQYGVAVVNGNLVIRSGAAVWCIRRKN